MSANSIERTTRLHELDLQHQQNRHKTDLISRDEAARRLELRLLLLKDEKVQLQEECAAKDAEIKALSQDGEQLRVELNRIKAGDSSKDAQVNGTATEMTGLATQTKSPETCMQDLSKALDENLALTKELQQLRPEIELLRQQVKKYERMIAEQRETQLQQEQSEKEPANKRQSKSEGSNEKGEDLAALRAALKKATEELNEEKRHRKTMESNHQGEMDKSERQKHRLEGKISTLEEKLKESQKELQNLRKDLEASRSSGKEDGPEDDTTSNAQGARAGSRTRGQSAATEKERLPRKHTARKRATEQAMVGEKSTFSITPLLNKTTESTVLKLPLDDVLASAENDPSPLRMANKSEAPATATLNVEDETTTPLRPREKLNPKAKNKPVAEEGDIGQANPEDKKDEAAPKAIRPKETAPSKRIKLHEPVVAEPPPPPEAEHRKRRRKLLNKTNTILEEDETEEGAHSLEAQPGRTRKFKSSETSAFSSQIGLKCPTWPGKQSKYYIFTDSSCISLLIVLCRLPLFFKPTQLHHWKVIKVL
ncbi:uncharacterized protein TRIREDRAFT_120529 [Trichoderma reesei QM6a]|uniref:Predicted protein n=1 Tax=Hypocrea jecorina (strain QM6a) TaxID=431241 RepID=G0RBD2_HYPJQ|nr:uncharacterized protein TRIREDRAFT_120529 [Trichoderma reesei QM6a]EGR51291.1 predicted protein [Trichoderma reesei QM6a]